MRHFRTIPTAALLVLAMGGVHGCAPVGPNYERPETAAATTFRGQSAPETRSIAELKWWEVYKDDNLQALIRDALANNYDARIAVARVEQSRAIAAQAKSLYYPTVNYQGAITSGRNEFGGSVSPNGGDEGSSGYAVFAAAWEIDLWGRIRRLNERALAELLATEEARYGVQASLVSDVATAYFELLELDLQLEIARRTAKSFGDSYKLFSQRLAGGAASKLETSRAEASEASVTARVPDIERQIVLKENQICVLLGRVPGPIERSGGLLDRRLPPEIPAGIPSELLERRPDIRQAEQELRAANATIGIAQAEFFPKIGLTAFFGQATNDVGDLFDTSSTAWSAGANFVGPLFTAGRTQAQVDEAKAAWEGARLRYQKTALTALKEVSDSLIDHEKLALVRTEQDRSVRAFREAVEVATKRYVAGKASYFEVLEAQQQLFPAENTLARVQLDQMLAIVRLYKSLGGGWEPDQPQDKDSASVQSPAAPATEPVTDSQ